MHLTSGSLRVFRRFSWLEVGSGKMALSRPAHQQVTRAVSQHGFFSKGVRAQNDGSRKIFSAFRQPSRFGCPVFVGCLFHSSSHGGTSLVSFRCVALFPWRVSLVSKMIVEEFASYRNQMAVSVCPRACHNRSRIFRYVILPASIRAARPGGFLSRSWSR